MEAFEGSKDFFKTLGEKAKAFGKTAIKEVKKVSGLHVGQVTEANPIYYIVIASQGAMVRKSIELDSEPVHGLRRGDLVTCVDVRGRRARLIDPVEGWVSIRTQDNEPILESTIAPDKQTQVSQMEKRFEKLKSEQKTASSSLNDGPSPASTTEAAAVDTTPSSATVSTIKAKLSFRPTAAQSLMSSADGARDIPKLSMPGSRKSPAPINPNAAQPNDLFAFDSPKSSDESRSQAPANAPISANASISAVADTTKKLDNPVRTDPFFDLLPPASVTIPNTQAPTVGSLAPSGAPAPTKNDMDDWFK